jgi:hypothetical protein
MGPIIAVSFLRVSPVDWTPSEVALSGQWLVITEGGGESLCGLDPANEAPQPPTVTGFAYRLPLFSRRLKNIPNPPGESQESKAEILAFSIERIGAIGEVEIGTVQHTLFIIFLPADSVEHPINGAFHITPTAAIVPADLNRFTVSGQLTRLNTIVVCEPRATPKAEVPAIIATLLVAGRIIRGAGIKAIPKTIDGIDPVPTSNQQNQQEKEFQSHRNTLHLDRNTNRAGQASEKKFQNVTQITRFPLDFSAGFDKLGLPVRSV